MYDIIAAQRRCKDLHQKVVNEVGEIDGIDFLILMFLVFDNAPEAVHNQHLMKGFNSDVRRACEIIADALEREGPII